MTIKVSFLILCGLLFFTACSKSDSAQDSNHTEKLLQGKWKLTAGKQVYYNSKNSIVYEDDNLGVSATVWSFDNGNITSAVDEDTLYAAYSIKGKILTITQEQEIDHLHITSLTDAILEVSETDSTETTFGTPPVISNYNVLTYHFDKM